MPVRVLLIEDDPTNQKLITYLLKAFGYETICAADGEAGLAAAARERPDLILSDIRLPKLSGYEVARQLKSDPALSAIPLLAVTASVMSEERKQILAAGFDGHIAKPISPKTFIQQLAFYLPPKPAPMPEA